MDELINTLKKVFGDRLVYIGLQGSYLRREETESSDIDVMAVIDNLTAEDERNYVKLSLNNLFHEICHRYVHADREKNISNLPLTCKSVFFIMQHLYYLNNGIFVPTKRELLECVQDEDKTVLELSISLQKNSDCDFDRAFSVLFNWCQNALARI